MALISTSFNYCSSRLSGWGGNETHSKDGEGMAEPAGVAFFAS